jgi:HD-GYP domain-containing protein (c-di-GMP phosphodiesterase class II)
VIKVSVIGKKAQEIQSILKSVQLYDGRGYDFVFVSLNVDSLTITEAFEKHPDVVVLCKGDLDDALIAKLLYYIDLYKTGVLWIMPEYSPKILNMLKTSLFDYIVGDILPFDISTRAYKLYQEKLYYSKYVHTKQVFHLSRRNLLRTLSDIAEQKSGFDPGHVTRVRQLFWTVGDIIKLPSGELDEMAVAAESHDIGKLGVSDGLLRLNGPLNVEEREQIKRHTFIGAEIIDSIGSAWGHLGIEGSIVLRYARDIALLHHEFCDGSGYPFGLKESEIPIYVRIATVVDIYDALTTERPYKKAWSPDKAIYYLKTDLKEKVDQNVVYALEQVVFKSNNTDKGVISYGQSKLK